MEQKKQRANPALLIIILLLVLVFLYSGLRFLEPTLFRNEGITPQETTGKTIVRDGIEYFPRQDITIIMLAGIDESGPVQDSGSYNNSGEADMVSLLIFDHKSQEIDILSINRDTMLDVPVLGIGGKTAGSIYGQLALAHTYGNGLQDSCVNLRKAVSDFLYCARIDYYVCLNMDAIALINDAVGGVTVNVTDDFSEVDSSITMGKVTLRGQQATTFVRTRQGVGSGMNVNRMQRQMEYMNGFMESLDVSLDGNRDFVVDTYQQLEPYMVTDCTAATINGILERYGDYKLDEIFTPEGENVRGEEFIEYYVDEDKLDALILEYLYAPKG